MREKREYLPENFKLPKCINPQTYLPWGYVTMLEQKKREEERLKEEKKEKERLKEEEKKEKERLKEQEKREEERLKEQKKREKERLKEEKKRENKYLKKRNKLSWRAKLWSMLAMELKNEVEAAKVAYDLDDTEESRKFAIAISSRNKRDKRIHEFAQDVAQKAGKTILELSERADKDSVRLAASIDILNRLGFKAPDRIEIDDKRELTDNDKIAVASVINILHPKITDAEIIGEKLPQ